MSTAIMSILWTINNTDNDSRYDSIVGKKGTSEHGYIHSGKRAGDVTVLGGGLWVLIDI